MRVNDIDFEWLEKALGQPLNEEERSALERYIQVVSIPSGMPIMHQGTAGDTLYIIRSGTTNISCKAGEKEILLASEDKSRVFGEISMFSGEPVNAKVTAAQPCIVYRISREHFEAIMVNHCKLALSMLAFIVRNMGDVVRRLDMKQTTGSNRHC